MNMKLNALAAAFASVGMTGAFAACPSNATVDGSCNIQATTQTVYLAGASAQAQAVNAVAKSLFDSPANVIQIKAGGTTSVNAQVAYYGLKGGVKTLLVYRNSGGSGAGVRQLISNTTAAYDALPAAASENNAITLSGCTIVSGSSGSYEASCTGRVKRVADLALSDVNFNELPTGVLPTPNASYIATSALDFTKTALQGFGVAVNTTAYAKLQDQNIAEGSLPGSCAGSSAAACQPSIRRADYASLVSQEGFIKTAADLFADASLPTTAITVCRRTDTSGTQASSNLFFLNNVSGLAGYRGALNPESVANGDVSYSLLSSSADVPTCLNNASGYRLGVLSLENIPGGSDSWRFIKIDGVSPNYTWDKAGAGALALDAKQRQQFAKGSYTFAFESVIAKRKSVTSGVVKAFYDALGTAIADSTQSDLVGFAYQDIGFGGWNAYDSSSSDPAANKQARVRRDGNNSQPLLP